MFELRSRRYAALFVRTEDGTCSAVDGHETREERGAPCLGCDAWKARVRWVGELPELVEYGVGGGHVMFCGGRLFEDGHGRGSFKLLVW